jgi:biotin carboxyl carrier protein
MSEIKGRVGPWEITYESVPLGTTGTCMAKVSGPGLSQPLRIPVRWKREDAGGGIGIELPQGVFQFDLMSDASFDSGDGTRAQYEVSRRGTAQSWRGVSFVRAGEEAIGGAEGAKKRSIRVRAQMPGKIIRILVKEGQSVEKGQGLLVMEAMKMENEIRAVQAGKVSKLDAVLGKNVETGAELLVLEPV